MSDIRRFFSPNNKKKTSSIANKQINGSNCENSNVTQEFIEQPLLKKVKKQHESKKQEDNIDNVDVAADMKNINDKLQIVKQNNHPSNTTGHDQNNHPSNTTGNDQNNHPSNTTDQDQNSLEFVENTLHQSWRDQLKKEFEKPYFKKLKEYLAKEYKNQTIYPPRNQIFAALNHCSFDQLKVVIIGQDPYHGPGQAHGLCFSVALGIRPPPSLLNIYKEAIQDVAITKPTHGCLTHWSNQGVLLLNTVLTVKAHCANSHKNQGWEIFTDKIIQVINDQTEGIIFLLWGKPAQEKCKLINTLKHHVIKSSHPSPLGATKTNSPFIGSRCFSRTNDLLGRMGKSPIDWNV